MADTISEAVYNLVRNHISQYPNTNFTTQVELVESAVKECLAVVEQFKYRMDAGADNVLVAIKEHFGVD